MKYVLLALCLFTALPAFAHDEDDVMNALYDQDGNYIGHEEQAQPLPFDPVYCDLNDDGQITADEIRPDNLDCAADLGDDNSIFAKAPIRALGLKKGELILTIDDGPNPRVTPKILDLLKSYNIKGTFFMTGSLVGRNAELVRRLEAEGHLPGNHTFNHVLTATNANMAAEIKLDHQALVSALGHAPHRLLFRAPGIPYGPWVAQGKSDALNADPLTRQYIGPIHANLGADPGKADWWCWSHGKTAQECADLYFQDIISGGRGIVLSHDIFYKDGHPNTYEMYKILLAKLEATGGITNCRSTNCPMKKGDGPGVWTFVTLEKNEFLKQYEGNGAQAFAPKALHDLNGTDAQVRQVAGTKHGKKKKKKKKSTKPAKEA